MNKDTPPAEVERLRANNAELKAAGAALTERASDFTRQAAATEAALRAEVERLREALSLSVKMLSRHEPGDSRAVSDEFVALAAVECELDDEACWACACIRTALRDNTP